MKVAVLGTGMYVTGRPLLGTGTVLGSLAEASRQLQLTEVIVIGRDVHGGSAVRESASTINRRLGTDLPVRYVQISGDLAYDLPKICVKERVQLAIVSVPDTLHAIAAESFVNAGVHCMVVKPLAPTSAEARRMCEAQRRNNVLGYVEFHKRYDEANCYAKRVLNEHAIGDIRYITVDYSQRLSMPLETFRSWSASVNIFQYLAVHYVDLIYFLTGALPWRASAVGTRGLLAGHGIDTLTPFTRRSSGKDRVLRQSSCPNLRSIDRPTDQHRAIGPALPDRRHQREAGPGTEAPRSGVGPGKRRTVDQSVFLTVLAHARWARSLRRLRAKEHRWLRPGRL